jgi:hypothetical protein
MCFGSLTGRRRAKLRQKKPQAENWVRLQASCRMNTLACNRCRWASVRSSQVVTEVFWALTPCSLVVGVDVSEKPTAVIFRIEMT